MQKWEYGFETRERGWNAPGSGETWCLAANWSPDSEEFQQILSRRGDEGWELVAVIAESSVLGGYRKEKSGFPVAPFAMSSDYAGYTDTEKWVFKRPKS